ncbi:MAG: helix-turn-helix transcriptional regulator [Chloroflexi bacterium]|nr:helix-turn-helix transcriptional regulator [Chloroflexota bacterium]
MFGNRLKTARMKHGLSQADLAQQIDAPPQQVQRWEKSSKGAYR